MTHHQPAEPARRALPRRGARRRRRRAAARRRASGRRRDRGRRGDRAGGGRRRRRASGATSSRWSTTLSRRRRRRRHGRAAGDGRDQPGSSASGIVALAARPRARQRDACYAGGRAAGRHRRATCRIPATSARSSASPRRPARPASSPPARRRSVRLEGAARHRWAARCACRSPSRHDARPHRRRAPHGCRIVATVPRGGTLAVRRELTGPLAVLIGGEGAGLAARARRRRRRARHDPDAAAGRVAERGGRRRR